MKTLSLISGLIACVSVAQSRVIETVGAENATCGSFRHFRDDEIVNIVGGRRAKPGEVPWQLYFLLVSFHVKIVQ